MNIALTLISPFLFIYTLIDFLIFSIFKKNTDLSYRIFRKTFAATSGRINDFLTFIISVFGKRFTDSELATLKSVNKDLLTERETFLESVRKDGYYVFETVTARDRLAKIKGGLDKIPLEYFDFNEGKYMIADGENHLAANKLDRSKHHLVNSKEVLDWALSKELVTLAQDYLGSKPHCDLLASWKSFPTDNKEKLNKAAQQFHFDMDRIKFIKFFVYLVDVGGGNGPHCYVKKSHKGLPFSLRRDGRFENELIVEHYGAESCVKIEGRAGTIIAVDTRGFHKGTPLVSGDRDILQVEFSNSHYGKNNEKSKIESVVLNKIEKQLLRNY